MLKLNKRVEYGLISVLHMDEAANRGLVTAKEIADRYNIPADLLGKVLQRLARGGIVSSVQGSRGGYCLERPLESLSIGDVVDVVEGRIKIAACCDGSTDCRQLETCNIKRPIQRIQEDLLSYVRDVPLSRFRERELVPAGKEGES